MVDGLSCMGRDIFPDKLVVLLSFTKNIDVTPPFQLH